MKFKLYIFTNLIKKIIWIFIFSMKYCYFWLPNKRTLVIINRYKCAFFLLWRFWNIIWNTEKMFPERSFSNHSVPNITCVTYITFSIMIFKKPQSLRSYLHGMNVKTLMIFCNDCRVKQALNAPLDNVSFMVQTGLDFMDADLEDNEALKKTLKEGCFDLILLVGHYPCMIHSHLNKGLKSSDRWRKTAERTRENFLKLEESGIRHLSDKEFSIIHLQQQLSYFRKLIPQDSQLLPKKTILKGLLSDKDNQVLEVELVDYIIHLN